MRTIFKLIKTVVITASGAAAGWALWRWLSEQQHEAEQTSKPEPEPEPEQTSKPEPEPEPVDVAGVHVEDPARVLAFVNTASEAALAEAGLARGPLATVLESRPFADLGALSGTRGIGPKTVKALVDAC